VENYFSELSQKIFASLQASEILLINYQGEDSDFSRFNNNKIRQAGFVRQQNLRLDLILHDRQNSVSLQLSGDIETDFSQCKTQLNALRAQNPFLPKDPYIHFATLANNTSYYAENHLPRTQDVIDQIIDTATDLDLVGIWASGSNAHGFANSLGQFNWHTDYNFNFDWSIYQSTDKAIKLNYAGFAWEQTQFQQKIEFARQTLPLLAQKPKIITPGHYRVFLTPNALNELLQILSWGGFGLKSHRTSQTPLLKMIKEGLTLSPKISLQENHKTGLTPCFTQQGHIKPDSVTLIKNGAYKTCLANHRSAKEYHTKVNCSVEDPQSLQMNPGQLKKSNIMQALDTGIYISNLWYCNYSDRNHCQITGMTRFATLWVENGLPVAPLSVMRFDASLFDALGKNLIDLTQETEKMLDTSTYERRSENSALIPGALIENFTFAS